MGTNYYWRDKICDSCNRYDEFHVCKSGSTWRAYRHSLLNQAAPEYGYLHESPFGFPILSLKDWERVFTERPGELWNQYGEQIENPIEWLARMDPWRPGPDGLRWLQQEINAGTVWFDERGFKFYSEEFC